VAIWARCLLPLAALAVSEARWGLVSARLLFGGLEVGMLVCLCWSHPGDVCWEMCTRGGFCPRLVTVCSTVSALFGVVCLAQLFGLSGGIVKCCEGVCVRVCVRLAVDGDGGERLKEE